MPHVTLPENVPGIRSLLVQFPETAGPLLDLAQTLLRGPSSLSEGERELIASYVSAGNSCIYCSRSHGAAAKELLSENSRWVEDALEHKIPEGVSSKMRSLLKIADKVRESGRSVFEEDVALARREGADDRTIHDTVLIAAAFSLYNRYVDGLATLKPDLRDYEAIGKRLATSGYA